MTSNASEINARVFDAIEGAPDVPAMREAWSAVTRLGSLNELQHGMFGTFTDGRLLTTRARGSEHTIDLFTLSYRTELVWQAMREADKTAPPPEDEPAKRGRPEIGPTVQVRLLPHMLRQADALAARRGVSRAEAIRLLVRTGLEQLPRLMA